MLAIEDDLLRRIKPKSDAKVDAESTRDLRLGSSSSGLPLQIIIRVEVEIDAPKSNLMMGAATRLGRLTNALSIGDAFVVFQDETSLASPQTRPDGP